MIEILYLLSGKIHGDFLWSILVYQRVSVVTFDITPFKGGWELINNFFWVTSKNGAILSYPNSNLLICTFHTPHPQPPKHPCVFLRCWRRSVWAVHDAQCRKVRGSQSRFAAKVGFDSSCGGLKVQRFIFSVLKVIFKQMDSDPIWFISIFLPPFQ